MNAQKLILIMLITTLAACSKENQQPKPKPSLLHGLYVLNEGLFNMNNATLTRYDFETSTSFTDYFEHTNGRRLGDTGNDMAIYGSKLFILTTVSSQLEVLDAATGRSLARVPLFDGNLARQPRALTFHDGHVFVACFDGKVLAIDTADYQIKNIGIAGQNPDGIAFAGNKLYVSNSGGLNFPTYDNTVSVLDPRTLTETKRITVETNPGAVVADAYGDVYVVCRGNYGNIPSSLAIIDSRTDAVKHTLQSPVLQLFIYGDTAWLTHIDYSGSMQSRIALMDVHSKQIVNEGFITDGTLPETVYGIFVDRSRKLVFIADARSFMHTGAVHGYNVTGQRQFSFSTGLNPSKIVGW